MKQKNFIKLKSWLTAATFLVVWVTYAQNISNPGFESYTSCPNTYSQMGLATGWSQPTAGNSDYFNGPPSCNYRVYMGTTSPVTISAQSGTAYAGGFMEVRSSPTGGNSKEYITNRLSTKLVAGTTYNVSFWTMHLFGNTWFSGFTNYNYVELPATEQGYIGLAFTAAAPTTANTSSNQATTPGQGGILNSWNPTKRTTIPASNTSVYGAASRNTWVPVTLTYTADGTEEYMTIGQWREDPTSLAVNQASYYLFDGFSPTVIPVPAASLTKAVSPAIITDGNTATYTFTITNTQAGSVALSNIRFTDTLPSGLRIANTPGIVVTGLTGGATTATAGGTSVVASNYTIAANTTATITVNVTNASGQLNPSCGSNPAAFTNSAANISNTNGLINNVGNVCLTVNTAPIVAQGCDYSNGALGMSDPVQGLWEALIMKSESGDFLVTGRTAHGNGSTNLTTFTTVANGSNGYSFTGTPLMMTGASTASTVSHQYFLLTTTGLYKWGGTAVISGSSAMASVALPTGLAVGIIQMMDAGRNGGVGSLMILTKQGEIWVYSNNAGNNVHGDGNIAGSNIWHKVMTSAGVPLTGMKDVRTMGQVATATDGNNIYTWGTGVYLGNGTAPQNLAYATLMTNPTGIALPILQQDLGGNSPSYYLRDSNGKVFTMGNNSSGKLGLGTTTEMRSWGEIQFVNEEPEAPGNQTDVTVPIKKVIWISANNHTSGIDTQFNLITEDNINYVAGSSNLDKQGVIIGPTGVDLPTPTAVTTNNGANKLPGKMIFVESAGKTSVLIEEGKENYGIVGEATNGGDGCPTCPYRPREYIFTTPAVGLVCGNAHLATSTGKVLWYKADQGVNTFTGVPASDNTQLTTWFDQATINGSQDGGPAAVHPATPLETDLPAMPYYRYNNTDHFNFNPVIHFDGANNGQAVQFTTPAKGDQTIFTVFKSPGTPSEDAFYASQLLYGGDVLRTNPTDGDAVIKSDLTLAVRSQSRLITGGGSNGDFTFRGDIMLNNMPSIGILKRNRVSQEEVYLSMYADGSTEFANQNADPTNTLTGEGRDLINSLRIGKAFSAYENGLSSPKGKLNGSVAEVIVYDEVLSDAEKAKVDTYLAVKYGITLTGGTKLFGATVGNADYDYVNSAGTVIRASDAIYKYDVFGLGRDDYFGLNQRITKSNNANEILTVSTNDNFSTLNLDPSRTAIDGDQEYMLFANNKGSSSIVTTQTTEVPSGILTRLDREWKTALANTDGSDISNVSLNFNLSGIALTGANLSTIKLLIDDDGDGDFTTGTVQRIAAASFTPGSSVSFDNINLANGQVFTLGITSLFCTQNPNTDPADEFTKVGISTLTSQTSGWPENIPNGWITMESKTQGFVITRVQHVGGGTNGAPAPTDSVTDPREGMVVYDIDDACVKLYNGSIWNCIERSCNTPTTN